MYQPDRNIVKKVKQYDPSLYFKWNERRSFWELWRKVDFKAPQLITPITQSIYDQNAPREFTSLDERIVWWLYAADTHKHGRNMYLEEDRRWLEFQKKIDRKRHEVYYDYGKDIYKDVNNFYLKKHAPKNAKPKFNNKRPKNTWVKPDAPARTSPRLFARTNKNAKAYDYKKV